jgi:hypothetical protein
MSAPTSVSIVINTLDRADSLAETLRACAQLTHPRFEVIVVSGPCTDHTDDVVAQWAGEVELRRCPAANLSQSRNIGIAAAAGDVVAFIDDDGVPEPTWLDELCAGYDAEDVGAVGGLVYDHTGRNFQVRYLLSDRLGNTETLDEMPPGDFSFPGSSRYPSMLGCNSSFRRAALVAVGGFDEQYDYFLDETDVCLRIVDAGWVVRGLDGAAVHHKYLPSAIRQRSKVVTDLHSVVKNKVYFSLVNGLDHWPWTDVMSDDVRFAAAQRETGQRHRQAGTIDDDGLAQVLRTIDSGWQAGLEDGLRGRRRLLDPASLEQRDLHPFPTVVASTPRRRLVFLTRTLPPEQQGGVGRYFLDLARGLAARGHEVRIVTTGSGHDRVDLEAGVWIHRVVKQATTAPPAHLPPVPAPLWDNAGPVAEEVLRIARERPVDAVFASIWDVEWVGVHAATSLPIVCGYTTPFSVVRATQPDSIGLDTATVEAIESLEAWAHRAAHAVQVNGEHVASSVAASSGVEFEQRARFVVPLGSGAAAAQDASHAAEQATEGSAERRTELLFVGRLEQRKGADLLLAAAPRILAADGNVHLTVVGDDAIPGAGGVTMRASFEAEHPDLVRSGAVSFLGVVDDAQLQQLRRRADVAVLPSRFESFGLVYVEAMAHATPVVALRGSGADEVVVDGVTGVLCDEDPDALAAAVLGLIDDPAAARAMGEAGRTRFEEHFTAEAMVDRFERLFASVRADRPGDAWAVEDSDLVALPDGSVGQLLAPGAVVGLAVPPGRATVVVAGAGAPSSIELHHGSEVIGSPVTDVEFRHLHLPAGATAVELEVVGDAAVVLAAIVVVDPDP